MYPLAGVTTQSITISSDKSKYYYLTVYLFWGIPTGQKNYTTVFWVFFLTIFSYHNIGGNVGIVRQ